MRYAIQHEDTAGPSRGNKASMGDFETQEKAIEAMLDLNAALLTIDEDGIFRDHNNREAFAPGDTALVMVDWTERVVPIPGTKHEGEGGPIQPEPEDQPAEGMTADRFEQWKHGCPKCGYGDIQYEATVTGTEFGTIRHNRGKMSVPDGTHFENSGLDVELPALHCNQCGLTERMTMEQCDTITFG